jgi:hypothetical protein
MEFITAYLDVMTSEATLSAPIWAQAVCWTPAVAFVGTFIVAPICFLAGVIDRVLYRRTVLRCTRYTKQASA